MKCWVIALLQSNAFFLPGTASLCKSAKRLMGYTLIKSHLLFEIRKEAPFNMTIFFSQLRIFFGYLVKIELLRVKSLRIFPSQRSECKVYSVWNYYGVMQQILLLEWFARKNALVKNWNVEDVVAQIRYCVANCYPKAKRCKINVLLQQLLPTQQNLWKFSKSKLLEKGSLSPCWWFGIKACSSVYQNHSKPFINDALTS